MLSIFSTIKFVRTMATNKGLNVVFHDRGPLVAYTDGKTVNLPRLSALATEEEYKVWLFLVYHELGHNTAPADDCFSEARKRKVDMSSTFGRMWNLIEDFRQEYLLTGKYLGRDRAVSEGRSIATIQSLKEIVGMEKPTDKQYPLWVAVFHTADLMRCRYQPDMYKVIPYNAATSTPESLEVQQMLKDKGLDEELFALKTASDTYEYVQKLLEEAGMDPEKAKEDGEHGAGGEGDGDDGKLSEALAELMDVMTSHSHEGEEGTQEVRVDGKVKRLRKGTPSGRAGPKSTSTEEYVCTEPNVISWEKYSGTKWQVQEIRSNALASHLRKVLQVRSQVGYEYGHKSGKLASKNLSRVITGKDTVYRRRDIRDTLDTAVSLLVDISGSMALTTKYPVAAAAAALMSRTLDLCGIKNEIISFTDDNPGSDRVLMKGWEERPPQSDLCQRFAKCGPGGNNLDGEAIQFAYERLTARPEKRKILLVLSDGKPHGYPKAGNEYTYTKQIINNIEKTDMEIYGIGFCTNTVKNFYREYTVVNEPEEITTALMEVITKKLI